MERNPGPNKKTAVATTFDKGIWQHRLIITLTLVAAATTVLDPVGTTGNLDALLLLLATAASIVILARRLPLQSVLFATFVTVVLGATAHGLSGCTGIPLGPVSFGEAIGPQLFKTVPWTVGLIWVIAIFNSRGVARIILRPWRKLKNYGFVLIGLTAALTMVFDLALEPYASAKRFWFWHPTKLHVTWHGASPLTFVGWAFVSVMILAVITPFLIRKQPGGSSAPELAPLALWLGAMALFAAVSAQAAYWPAVILDAAAAVVVGMFAWRGARW